MNKHNQQSYKKFRQRKRYGRVNTRYIPGHKIIMPVRMYSLISSAGAYACTCTQARKCKKLLKLTL